jgi:hypothetical protein
LSVDFSEYDRLLFTVGLNVPKLIGQAILIDKFLRHIKI